MFASLPYSRKPGHRSFGVVSIRILKNRSNNNIFVIWSINTVFPHLFHNFMVCDWEEFSFSILIDRKLLDKRDYLWLSYLGEYLSLPRNMFLQRLRLVYRAAVRCTWPRKLVLVASPVLAYFSMNLLRMVTTSSGGFPWFSLWWSFFGLSDLIMVLVAKYQNILFSPPLASPNTTLQL